MTKTKNKKNIKRQNQKNLIFKRNVVVVEKKCDNDLKKCLSEKKTKKKKQCEKSIKRAFVNYERKKKTKINNFSNIIFIFIIALFLNF